MLGLLSACPPEPHLQDIGRGGLRLAERKAICTFISDMFKMGKNKSGGTDDVKIKNKLAKNQTNKTPVP